jgi:hypothetical protein
VAMILLTIRFFNSRLLSLPSYIYIYICVCVCVSISIFWMEDWAGILLVCSNGEGIWLNRVSQRSSSMHLLLWAIRDVGQGLPDSAGATHEIMGPTPAMLTKMGDHPDAGREG